MSHFETIQYAGKEFGIFRNSDNVLLILPGVGSTVRGYDDKYVIIGEFAYEIIIQAYMPDFDLITEIENLINSDNPASGIDFTPTVEYNLNHRI